MTTEEKQSVIGELEEKIKDFESLRLSFSGYGTTDTEPDWQFQNCLKNALEGDIKIPCTSSGWEIYSSMPGSDEVAEKLYESALEVVDFMRQQTIETYSDIKEYLTEYCWRIDI